MRKSELAEIVKLMIKSIEELPQHAMLHPINNYDYIAILSLLVKILECDDFDCK